MGLTLVIIELYLRIDYIIVRSDGTQKFLQNHGLHLEPTHVLIVSHNSQGLM